MLAKKLINLLHILSKEECLEFEHQINYKHPDKLLAVFRFVKESIEQNNGQEELKQFLEKSVISMSYWKVLIRSLIHKLEDFLISKSLDSTPNHRSLLLRKVLDDRQLNNTFLKNIEKEKTQVEKKPIDSNNFIFIYWLERDYIHFKNVKGNKKVGISHNVACIKTLDRYYIIQRIKLMMEFNILTSRAPNTPSEDIPLLSQLNEIIHSGYFEGDILFKIYVIAFKLLFNKSNKHEELSNILKDNIDLISKRDLFYIYTILIDFYIKQKSTDQSNLKKVLDLYKEMIHFKFLEIENFVTPIKFRNIVTTACIFKEFEWVLDFIKKHQELLEPKNRKSIIHFNMGAVYFYQKEFEAAQNHLIQVEGLDVLYTLDTKSLLARIYFEKGEYLALIRFLSSFKEFIRKNSKLNKNLKNAYMNYVNILEQLSKTMQLSLKKRYKEKMLEKLYTYSQIVQKDWLEEKIKNL